MKEESEITMTKMTKKEALEIMNANACFWAEDAFGRNSPFTPFRSLDEFGSEAVSIARAGDALGLSQAELFRQCSELAELHMERMEYNKTMASRIRG